MKKIIYIAVCVLIAAGSYTFARSSTSPDETNNIAPVATPEIVQSPVTATPTPAAPAAPVSKSTSTPSKIYTQEDFDRVRSIQIHPNVDTSVDTSRFDSDFDPEMPSVPDPIKYRTPVSSPIRPHSGIGY